jgi:uncharacterized membrane protein YgcG
MPARDRGRGMKPMTLKRIIEQLFGTDEQRACEGKVKYGHKETADKAATVMLKKYGETLESYECRYCGKWHIGHTKAQGISITVRRVK